MRLGTRLYIGQRLNKASLKQASTAHMKARDVSLTALFTALVCAFTVSIQVYIPATRGYFNVGEVMVYTAALVAGPWVGAFAGGVGSMLADLATGYVVYAPATLVIKGLEGLIVGALSRVRAFKSRGAWTASSIAAASTVSALLVLVGPYYVGEAELTLSLLQAGLTLRTVIPWALWPILAVASAALIVYAGLKVDPEVGWAALSMVAGGAVMVTGYYLYEQLFMGVAAIVEVPFNVAQCLIGLLVALPLSRALVSAVPSLRPEQA